jgi:two-component system, OmpR family, KDP operon response regulator KdpE
MGAEVLVVDDEPHMRRVLSLGLSSRGFSVETVGLGRDALDRVKLGGIDVVLLDLMLPDISGVDVLQEIRNWSTVPIIVLSAIADADEKVRALDVGADDYLTKGFAMDELAARIRVALRHLATSNPREPIIRIGSLCIDFPARRVTMGDQAVDLTVIEFGILRALAQNPGMVVTHEALLRSVWGPMYGGERNYVHVYIRRLRRKIEPDPQNPRYVLTEPGAGYRLRDEPDDRSI